ncbi:MAG: hypothetical protein P8165_16110 [Deltaproteobacteria bacterium]|jgi:hypothetical protein
MPKEGGKEKDVPRKKKSPATRTSDTEPFGAFEVQMFPSHVDSPSHPYADQLKEMLEEVAGEYGCRLLSFGVRKGTVTFSFDSDALNADILRIIQGESDR